MSKCPKCKRPINDGNSPNEFECTEPDDDEGVCEAYAKIAALRTRLAESEASLEEYRMRLAGALTTSEGNNLDVQDDPRSLDYLRRCPTIRSVVRLRAERDDLLGALRGLEVSVQAMLAERDQALADYQSLGAEVLKLTAARDRALACEAAARGLLKSLAETILNIEGDRTSRGHEARSEAVIRACVRALSSPPSPTSAPDQEPGEGGPCLWCGKSYTAKAVDIAWDSGKHLVGVAECPACQYPALVKMDAPEVERGKCGKCPSCYGKGRYSLQLEDGGLCDRCGGTGRGGTNG